MGKKLLQQMRRVANADNDDRLICVEAIVSVTDDPEHQHRIKVVIPMMDEDRVRDEWVRPMVPYVGGPGFGSFFVPAKGSEVVLFGRLGQKHSLFYMSVYNETHPVPADFQLQDPETVAGFRVPVDFKLIVAGDFQINCGALQIEATGAINIIAPAGFFVNGNKVG